jgi:uncharacterized protein YaaN involved in tellurite resistance
LQNQIENLKHALDTKQEGLARENQSLVEENQKLASYIHKYEEKLQTINAEREMK